MTQAPCSRTPGGRRADRRGSLLDGVLPGNHGGYA